MIHDVKTPSWKQIYCLKLLQFPNKKYKKASIWLIQKYKANIKL